MGSILHFDSKKRMKLKELFQCKLFKNKTLSNSLKINGTLSESIPSQSSSISMPQSQSSSTGSSKSGKAKTQDSDKNISITKTDKGSLPAILADN
jgi:hypothetical protein